MTEVSRNLLMLGDSGIGKTHMFYCFLRGKPPEECFLPLSNSVTHEMDIEGTNVLLGLSPIDGPMPDLSSGSASFNVVLMCFALDKMESLQSIADTYVPLMTSELPGVPIILVGTKLDLRKDKKVKTIPKNKCKEVCQSIGAVAYMECSSSTKEGIQDIFNLAAKTALRASTRKSITVSKASYKSPNSKILNGSNAHGEPDKTQETTVTETEKTVTNSQPSSTDEKNKKQKNVKKKSSCHIL